MSKIICPICSHTLFFVDDKFKARISSCKEQKNKEMKENSFSLLCPHHKGSVMVICK